MAVVKNIGIVGAGAIGAALGEVATASGKKVFYWDKEPAKSTVRDLAELVQQSSVIILCVPSWANAQAAHDIAEVMSGDRKLVLSVAKGVEEGFKLVPEVLEAAGLADYGVLYGPMLAEELANEKHGSAVMAVSDASWLDCLDLTASRFMIVYSDDPNGVATCGVLKNIYAVGLGISDGLGLGQNAKGQLAVKMVGEMKELVKKLGHDASPVDGLAGLGDLLATGWSEVSFNHRIGRALAAGIMDEAEANGEGVRSVRELSKLVELADFPVADMINQIIAGTSEPEDLENLLG